MNRYNDALDGFYAGQTQRIKKQAKHISLAIKEGNEKLLYKVGDTVCNLLRGKRKVVIDDAYILLGFAYYECRYLDKNGFPEKDSKDFKNWVRLRNKDITQV